MISLAPIKYNNTVSMTNMEICAIITGDIVDSRSKDIKEWLPILDSALRHYSENFDIFRGDSFQAEVQLDQSIEALFYIKSRIKSLGDIDVRMGLGIGGISYIDSHIKKSSGEAFIYSGEAFESLNKDLILVKSKWPGWDESTNLILSLAMEIANKWTTNMAETVAETLRSPDANQLELAKRLNKKYQSQVSTELTKASWAKLSKAIKYCTDQLLKKC